MNHPIAAPATTSPGKCFCAATRAPTTRPASEYAMIGTAMLCRYWWAKTDASANVLIAWPEGKARIQTAARRVPEMAFAVAFQRTRAVRGSS